MRTILAAIGLAALLMGCDTVEGMRDMKDTQVELKGLIGEEIGVEPLVGFNLDGGVLIDVSVGFSAGDVRDRSVSELMRAVRRAVETSFKTRPQAIYIQLELGPG